MLYLIFSSLKTKIGLSEYLFAQKINKQQTVLNKQLAEEIHLLESEIKKLKTSPKYALKKLKEKYHIIEPNEKIIFFAD